MAEKKKSKKSEWLKLREDINKDMTRTVGVIVEDFDRKLDLVVEQHGGMNDKIDTLSTCLDTIDTRLDTIDTRLINVEEQVGSLSVNMTIVKEQLEILNSGIKRKVDFEEFEALRRRVLSLEKRK